MTLEECYLSILKNSNSWNPTKSHTIEELQSRAERLVDWLSVQINNIENGFEIILL